MEIDFTRLSGIPTAAGSEPPEKETGKLQHIADQNQNEKAKAAEVYRQHQQAAIKSGTLVTEIRQGILSGCSVYALLIKAMEAIELTTGESGLAAHAAEDIIAIYGYALGEPEPLSMELANLDQRLEKLNAALKTADAATADSVRRAIRVHERKREELKKRTERDE